MMMIYNHRYLIFIRLPLKVENCQKIIMILILKMSLVNIIIQVKIKIIIGVTRNFRRKMDLMIWFWFHWKVVIIMIKVWHKNSRKEILFNQPIKTSSLLQIFTQHKNYPKVKRKVLPRLLNQLE